MRVTKWGRVRSGLMFLSCMASLMVAFVPRAAAGDAPQWMHALVGAQLPQYDDKTSAVVLYSDMSVTVLSFTAIPLMSSGDNRSRAGRSGLCARSDFHSAVLSYPHIKMF